MLLTIMLLVSSKQPLGFALAYKSTFGAKVLKIFST